jgi:hypothetical protein
MEMVVTPMAIGTMADSRETTLMFITMVTTMEAMDITMEAMDVRMEAMDIIMEVMYITVLTRMLRRISCTSSATTARSLDILQTIALKGSLMNLPNPIHFRRDRSTTSIWRR